MVTAYRRPFDPVSSFQYLGRVLLVAYDNWTKVVCNLRHTRKKWARLTRVLGIDGADDWTPGMLYIVVVQAVLLYGLET